MKTESIRKYVIPAARRAAMAMALLAAAAAQTPASAQASGAALRRQPPAQVLPRVEAWLQLHPRDAEAWKLAAAMQLKLQKPEAAASSLERVIELQPADTPVRLTLLQLLSTSPRCAPDAGHGVAAAAPAPAPATSPCAARLRQLWQGLPPAAQNDAAVEVLHVRVLLAEGRSAEGVAAAERLARQHARDARMQFTLGAALLQAGQAAAALPRLQAARHLLGAKQTDDALAFDLALAHYDLGDAAAAPAFQRLHQRHPEDWEPAWYLAQIDIRQGNWGGATEYLVAAQQKHPDQPELAKALATLAARQAFWVDAMDEWKTYRRLRPDDIDGLEQLAVAAQMSRHARFAEQCMRQYLAARSGDAHGYYLLALIEKDQGADVKARQALDTVLRLNPHDDHAWSTLGQLELGGGHMQKADQDFRKALQFSAVNADALTGEAQCLSRQGELNQALHLLQQAVQQQPHDLAAWYQLSVIARRAGEKSVGLHAAAEFRRLQADRMTSGGSGLLAYFKADAGLSPEQRRAHYIAFLQKALSTRPDDPRILSRMGIAWLQGGDTRPALAVFERIAGQPMPAADALRAGEALLAAHQPELALRFFTQAGAAPGGAGSVGLAVDEARAWLQQNHPNRALQVLAEVPAAAQPAGVAADMAALIYAAAGDDVHAAAAFRVALQTGAGRPAIARDAATFLGSRSRWREALDVIRSARLQSPDSPELALEEAIFLQLAGHRAAAQQQLRALAFDPSDPELTPAQRQAAVLLGISYYTSDDRAKAESLFRQLTQSAPDLAQPWYYRALLASENNQPTDALRWVRRALQLDPDAAEAWYLEGKLLAAQRQFPAARDAFQQAMHLNRSWAAPHAALARMLRDQGETAAAAAQLAAFQQLSTKGSQGEGEQLRAFLQGELRGLNGSRP